MPDWTWGEWVKFIGLPTTVLGILGWRKPLWRVGKSLARYLRSLARAPIVLARVEAELAELKGGQAQPSDVDVPDVFEMHGVWWGYSEGDGLNAPFCPVCATDGKLSPLKRRDKGPAFLLECLAHPVPCPYWELSKHDFEAARQKGRIAGGAVTAGVARIPGTPVTPSSRRFGRRSTSEGS